MAYNEDKLTKLKALKELGTRINARLEALETSDAPIKAAAVTNNTLKFFTTTDTTQAAAFTFDLPAEQFLDAASTQFVPNFAFSAATYSGAENPNLDGKPVMVLGVKTKNNNETSTTTAYSFLDMSKLVDTYTASDTSVVISDYKVKANVSSTTGNLLSTTANGLFVDGSGKVDKVTTATAGNVVGFGANGALSDTGIASANVLTKVTGAVAGNLVSFVSGGGIADSGIAIATDAEVTEMLNEVLGS